MNVVRALLTSLVLVAIAAVAPATETDRRSTANQANLGLEKLSERERIEVYRLFERNTARDLLTVTAHRYMHDEGWRHIQVIDGYKADSPTEESEIVIRDGYKIVVLRPFSSMAELPLPGWYWGQNTLSSWRLLTAECEELSFSVADR